MQKQKTSPNKISAFQNLGARTAHEANQAAQFQAGYKAEDLAQAGLLGSVKVPEVWTQLQELEVAVELLGNSLVSLTDRLSPIAHWPMVEPQGQSGATVKPAALVPLAQQIEKQVDLLKSFNARINNFNSVLEL